MALHSSRIVAGASNKMSLDEQARRMGEAWEQSGPGRRGLTFEIIEPSGKSHFYDLGPHPPRLWPEDINRVHNLWLKLTRERFGGRLHHRDIVGVALRRLQRDLNSPERQDEALKDVDREVEYADREDERS